MTLLFVVKVIFGSFFCTSYCAAVP